MKVNTKTLFTRRVWRGHGSVSFPANSVHPPGTIAGGAHAPCTVPTTNPVASVPVINATYVAMPNTHASSTATASYPAPTLPIASTTVSYPAPTLPIASATASFSALTIGASAQNPNAIAANNVAYTAPGHSVPCITPSLSSSSSSSSVPSVGMWCWKNETGGWIAYDANCSQLIQSVCHFVYMYTLYPVYPFAIHCVTSDL